MEQSVFLYRKGTKDDAKELKNKLKSKIDKLSNNMNKLDGSLRAEIRRICGGRIDSLEAREVKLENWTGNRNGQDSEGYWPNCEFGLGIKTARLWGQSHPGTTLGASVKE